MCDCGNFATVLSGNLKNGQTKSCGCLKFEFKDLTGKQFERLEVISRVENKNNRHYYKCLCLCKNTKIVSAHSLVRGKVKSCGCLQKEITSKNSKVDHTGKIFNQLLVLKRIESQPLTKYLCQCNCGKQIILYGCSLTTNHTKSCGCLKTSKMLSSHKLYGTWHDMKLRCTNKNLKNYKHYGERGIKVCERWSESFLNFLEDMGEKSSPKLSIDRINNDGNYSCGKCDECIKNNWPANCRWATAKEQANNTRRNS